MQALSVPALLEQLSLEAGVAVVRDGASTIVAAEPAHVRVAHGVDGFRALDAIEREGGWWAGFLAYDLGRAVERVVPWAAADRAIPDLALARYDACVRFTPGEEPVVEGTGLARLCLERALWNARRSELRTQPVGLEHWTSSLDRVAYVEGVKSIHGLLDAGECYQVNLTRRLSTPRAADPRALYLALDRQNPAPHLALMTFGREAPYCPAVVCASPELFLSLRGTRVTTRPIKGTHADRAALLGSTKDRAEHVMIVDLARNDLGRVCEPGSVRTLELAALEEHPGLFHLVSTIEGRRRESVGLADLIHATFPPASITGAPKPRVMQAIEDLEPVRRGVYCGAIGWIDVDERAAELAVAIRTFTISGGHTDLGVGGGIVADSDARSEWAETELKAARLLAAAGPDGASVAPTSARP
ncbi:MAG TPA: anthranilate synthase component I family protein [Acidimicrobiia bacterium]|nr:anthranilate synthase component I family protein [Acidimicrobiia bacterium]